MITVHVLHSKILITLGSVLLVACGGADPDELSFSGGKMEKTDLIVVDKGHYVVCDPGWNDPFCGERAEAENWKVVYTPRIDSQKLPNQINDSISEPDELHEYHLHYNCSEVFFDWASIFVQAYDPSNTFDTLLELEFTNKVRIQVNNNYRSSIMDAFSVSADELINSSCELTMRIHANLHTSGGKRQQNGVIDFT